MIGGYSRERVEAGSWELGQRQQRTSSELC